MNFTPMAELSANDKARFKELPVEIVSYDDGYYAKKVVSNKVPQGAALRTLTGFTTQRMSATSAVLGARTIPGVELKRSPTDTMRFLFGMHADQQIEGLTTKTSDEGGATLQQFFAASLSLALPAPGAYRVRAVVLMPVVAFKKDAEYKEHIADTLRGLYTFAALKSFEDGKPIYEEYTIYVESVIAIEQPLGSLFHMMYSKQSFINPQQILRQRNSIFDWGLGTLDILTVQSELGQLQRIERMTDSAKAGAQVLFDYVRDTVFVPLKITQPTPMELEQHIMEGRYKFNTHPRLWPAGVDANGYFDLKPAIAQGAEEMWNASMHLFEATVGAQAPTIDTIFLTGGTSGWMQQYVLDHFGEHRVIKSMESPVLDPNHPYRHLMLSDLHLRNAIGGFLYAKSL